MNKTELKERFDRLVWFSNNLKEGNIKNVPEAMIKRNDEARELKKIISEGCGNIVDRGGDCMYISNQGNERHCSTCKKRLKYLNGVLK